RLDPLDDISRRASERVAVEVDQVGVRDEEPGPELGQRVLGVEPLGSCTRGDVQPRPVQRVRHASAEHARSGWTSIGGVAVTAAPPARTPARTYRGWAVAAWLGLGVVALLSLAQPLSGDQAFFFVIARQLRHGDVLYGDVVDTKQPLIFVFYLI